MTIYQPGEMVLVNFPFTSSGTGKPRPAMVVLDTGDADVVLARVTTQFSTTPFDVALQQWQNAGLLAPSVVRLHKVATIEKSLIMRALGVVDATDRATISTTIRSIFGSW